MDSDAELVCRVRRGDVESFGLLCRRYERTLLSVALAETRDIHVAEDVVQETLLLAFRKIDSLRDDAKFGSWLIMIARRQVAEAVRAPRMALSVPANDAEPESAVNTEVETWIDHEHLLALVGRLPERERILIGLRHFDGLSVSQIAAITSRPVGTVTKQLSRAIARLRGWWDKENRK